MIWKDAWQSITFSEKYKSRFSEKCKSRFSEKYRDKSRRFSEKYKSEMRVWGLARRSRQGRFRDRNDAASRPCMAWAAADIDRELNAPPVVLWPLIPHPPLRIPDVARLKRCLQTPLLIQNFCDALLCIWVVFQPPFQ